MEFYWIYFFIFFLLMSASALQARKQADEEENNPDLESPGSWEYKILRSRKNQFKDLDFQCQVLAEDAEAGWVLLEKIDNARLRLKRPIEERQRDELLEFDPYRISTASILKAIKKRTES